MEPSTVIQGISTTIKVINFLERHSKSFRNFRNDISEIFLFETYSKNLTVLPNGHGLIISTFRIKILDLKKFTDFKRWMTLYDASSSVEFPNERSLTSQNLEDRYKVFGMWYINSHEFKIQNFKISNQNKRIDWEFKLNKTKIINRDAWPLYFDISYAFSIPGLFPIYKGYWNKSATPTGFTNEQKTTLTVDHVIKDFVYTIKFDRNIHLELEPEFVIIPKNQDEKNFQNGTQLELIERNAIYNKYEFRTQIPIIGSKIKIDWKVEKLKRATPNERIRSKK